MGNSTHTFWLIKRGLLSGDLVDDADLLLWLQIGIDCQIHLAQPFLNNGIAEFEESWLQAHKALG